MNYNDITIGIVTFKSEKVIFNCLKSIKNIKKIIIFDNSNDTELKYKITKKYPNVKFITSKENLGFGGGNNQILKKSKSKYVFLLSPDTILKNNCEHELLKQINKIKDFSLIAPLAKENNYGFFKGSKKVTNNNFFEVDYVKGFAMLFNLKKIGKRKIFDENIFLYLEEIDLCKRLRDNNYKIYVNTKAKIFHKAGKSSDIGFEFEKCRHWHWMWSSVYYKRKHFNNLKTLINFIPLVFTNLLKSIFFVIIFQPRKIVINFMRFSGALNALLGKNSWYRPN